MSSHLVALDKESRIKGEGWHSTTTTTMATSDSRFKPFKFNARSKPPPLPPKDSIYLEQNNPSISSIDIQPNSPMSPPLITTNPSTHPSDRMSTRKDKALAFLKFPKRSPRSPSGSGGGEGFGNEDLENPPPPEPDSRISTPWNFQVRLFLSFLSFLITSTLAQHPR